MSYFSDFFVAAPQALAKADLSEGPDGLFRSVSYKNTGELEVATLENILTGADVQKALNLMYQRPALSDESEDRIVCRLSDAITRALAGLTPAAAEAAARKWLETEEWKRSGAGEADVPGFAEMLLELGKLARSAAPGQALYLMTSGW